MPPFAYKTNAKITSFCVTQNDISLKIKTLDPRKAHGFGNISMKMTQICGESVALPLKLIFKTALKVKRFPDSWKIANVISAHNKDRKNLLKSFHPISLLPIFSKIFERVIYNALFNHLVSNKLSTHSQSGFLPGVSCIA